jgi:hypothetical protein
MEHVAARIDHLELQLGEALPPMANTTQGHSSSGSGRSSVSTRDPDGDWLGSTHPGENFHAASTTLFVRPQPPTNLAWLLDSGASIHLVNNPQYLHNPVMYQSPKPLHLATSDAVGGIIAKGSVCLLDARGAQLWIHNVQCVPAATTNLISVTAAIRDGCQFRTDSKGAHIQMVGPAAWECDINMSKGLYYLQRIQCRSLASAQSSISCQKVQKPQYSSLTTASRGTSGTDAWAIQEQTVMSRITREGLDLWSSCVPLYPVQTAPLFVKLVFRGSFLAHHFQTVQGLPVVFWNAYIWTQLENSLSQLSLEKSIGSQYWMKHHTVLQLSQ